MGDVLCLGYFGFDCPVRAPKTAKGNSAKRCISCDKNNRRVKQRKPCKMGTADKCLRNLETRRCGHCDDMSAQIAANKARAGNPICKIESCDGRVIGWGWCRKHYYRNYYHGDPNAFAFNHEEHRAFVRSACASETDDCIVWPFDSLSNGYGMIAMHGTSMTASRAALIESEGFPPTKDHVCAHLPVVCHNRACINPRHLRWATQAENQADRRIDGTMCIGENSPSAKLNDAAVIEILKSDEPHHLMAKRYGVTQPTISRVVRRESWKHVEVQS